MSNAVITWITKACFGLMIRLYNLICMNSGYEFTTVWVIWLNTIILEVIKSIHLGWQTRGQPRRSQCCITNSWNNFITLPQRKSTQPLPLSMKNARVNSAPAACALQLACWNRFQHACRLQSLLRLWDHHAGAIISAQIRKPLHCSAVLCCLL